MTNNSFLFGTMHLQDKRLFYFSDSLYHYLEKADGYALEIDLQEFMDSVIQKVVDQKQEEWFDKKRLKGKDKKKIIDSLVQNVKKLNDKASKRQLEQLRDEKVRKAMKNNEMPTIMDAYLYGIAKRQGKWLGGIEDVQDQLYLLDELGGEITSEELLLPDAELVSYLEKMVAIYLSADLTKLEKYTAGNFSLNLENMMFLNRNIKMARRMDSLAQVRSTFFSVGAAHLPGDSGVINLLKSKGYKLDPVFSSKKIDPDNYAYKLSEVSWVNVEDEEKTYEVKMPGKASDLNMFDGAIKMKFYVDITSLTYYMSGSTFGAQHADLSKVIEKFAENTDGLILSKRFIEKTGLKGIEGVVLANDYYYKVQYFARDNRVFILIAGGDKKEMLETPDVKKFLQSLVVNKTKIEEKQKEWRDFNLEDKAFTIHFPGNPKQNKSTEKKAEGSEWTFTVYDYMDPTTGMYYMVQVRDLRPGYYLTGDSAYFNSFRENLTLAIKKVTEEEVTTFQSFPAYRFNGESEEGDIRYNTLTINRGNRVYTLFTGGAPGEANELYMDKFINSFNLKEYKKIEWQKTSPEEKDFYTLAPVELPLSDNDIIKVTPDEENKNSHFLRFNPYDAVSYEIFKTPVSPYYWIGNDSLFFDSMGMGYKKEKDSVMSKTPVTNGGLKGMEWVFQMHENNIRKKIRQVLSGDTLYSLMSFIPSQYIYGREAAQFFEEFRVTNEKINTGILKSKAALIFRNLLSGDSSTFADASEAISIAPFQKEDLPFLHQGLLHIYVDDTMDYNTRTTDKIINVLEPLADSSTVEFIMEHFKELTNEKELLKFDLMEVLAGIKTDYSYAALKSLLLDHTPIKKGKNDLSYRIIDSLQLAAKLYPELLNLSKNNLYAERIIVFSRYLLDSNLISREMLMPYKNIFLHTADTLLSILMNKEESFPGYRYLDMLHLLAGLNDPACNQVLKDYLSVNSLLIKEEAVMGLLKNQQVVPASVIEVLVANKAYRRDMYTNLKKINKAALYPLKYKTQRHLGESDMYNYSFSEEEPSEMSYIGERNILFNGKKCRFYLYKLVYTYESAEDDKKEEYKYLGVAGPFSTDLKNLEMEFDLTGIYDEEAFDPKNTDKQLSAYLRSIEKTGTKK